MADLWQAALSAWPGKLPSAQPVGMHLDKTRISRGDHIKPRPGALLLVLSGALSEWMHPTDGHSCIVRDYGPRDLVVMPVGRLSADVITDVLVLVPGWEQHLPQAHALVCMLRDAEGVEFKSRIAQAMCLPVTERIREFVIDNGLDASKANRQRIAYQVGCSREMVSKILTAMVKEGA